MQIHDLNYRHLYYFWAVASEGHLTQAARKLHISQSALSHQVRLLEEFLGHDLFVRERKGLSITEMGRLVLEYADSVFSIGREMLATVEAGEKEGKQELRIGSVATLSRNFQEGLLHPLLEMEEVTLVLESGGLEDLMEKLSLHKLHLVLSNRPVTSSEGADVRCRRIARQQVCLIGPPRRKKKAFLFPEDLENRKLILPGYSSDIRTAFDLLCEDLNLDISVFAEIDDMALLRLLAKNSDFVALAPAVVVKDELSSGILEKYCVVPKVYENFYAITTERHFTPRALKKILGSSADIRKRILVEE